VRHLLAAKDAGKVEGGELGMLVEEDEGHAKNQRLLEQKDGVVYASCKRKVKLAKADEKLGEAPAGIQDKRLLLGLTREVDGPRDLVIRGGSARDGGEDAEKEGAAVLDRNRESVYESAAWKLKLLHELCVHHGHGELLDHEPLDGLVGEGPFCMENIRAKHKSKQEKNIETWS